MRLARMKIAELRSGMEKRARICHINNITYPDPWWGYQPSSDRSYSELRWEKWSDSLHSTYRRVIPHIYVATENNAISRRVFVLRFINFTITTREKKILPSGAWTSTMREKKFYKLFWRKVETAENRRQIRWNSMLVANDVGICHRKTKFLTKTGFRVY